MYELIQAADNTYYIDCPAKIGVYVSGSEATLIDSGSDKDAAKKVLKIINAEGWQLTRIINTHYHADHVGGNALLQQRTGCKIYANGIEAAFARWTVLEPISLGGALPLKELKNKFLMAQPSEVLPLAEAELPSGFELIPLSGHSPEMVGVRTPDDVIFAADCVNSAATLEKYKIGVIYDVAAYLETLERVGSMKARLFVPAHAEPTADMSALAELNRAAVYEIRDAILQICAAPVSFEELLKRIFDRYSLEMTLQQHTLVGSTVRSYLVWLTDTAALSHRIEQNRLVWQTVGE